MRFQVPQFIDVEDKIFGPLTFKQFVYLAGGGGLCAIFFTLLPTYIAIFLSIPVAAFALALAFYKINSKPFVAVVEAFLAYSLGSKLYIWKKEDKTPVAGDRTVKPPVQVYVPKLSESKLKDLSLALDVRSVQDSNSKDTL